MENINFEERVIYNCKSHKSMIVLWDYDDQHSIDPVLVLICPLEIICFQFNPKDPNILVGGGTNGQIFLWDLKMNPNTQNANKKG
jgi:WD40 repeat protein